MVKDLRRNVFLGAYFIIELHATQLVRQLVNCMSKPKSELRNNPMTYCTASQRHPLTRNVQAPLFLRHFSSSLLRSSVWPLPTLRSSRFSSKPGALSEATGLMR